MAAIDYPHTPILGEEHTDDDGITWICENATGPVWGPKLTEEQLAALNIDLETGSVTDVELYMPILQDTIDSSWINATAIPFPTATVFILEPNLLSVYNISSAVPEIIKTISVINGISVKIVNGEIFIASSTVGIIKYDIKNDYYKTDLGSLLTSPVIRSFNAVASSSKIGALLTIANVVGVDVILNTIVTSVVDYTSGAYEALALNDFTLAVSSDTRRLSILPINLIANSSITIGEDYDETSIPAILTVAGWVSKVTKVSDDHLIAAIDGPDALLHLWLRGGQQRYNFVAHVTNTYFTGRMYGDNLLVALANSATADRSVKGNILTEIGTITESPVATDCDLLAYSGFSISNWIEQAYNSDFDLGFGDISFKVHCFRTLLDIDQYILQRADADGTPSIYIMVNAANKYVIGVIRHDAIVYEAVSTVNAAVNEWEYIECAMGSYGGDPVLSIKINGVQNTIVVLSGLGVSISSIDLAAKLTLGNDYTHLKPWSGSLSLLHISGGNSSIYYSDSLTTYEYEKDKFKAGNRCLIQGDSSVISDIHNSEADDAYTIATATNVTTFKNGVVIEDDELIVDSVSTINDKRITGVIL